MEIKIKNKNTNVIGNVGFPLIISKSNHVFELDRIPITASDPHL
jgi:hypothetical protein